MTATLAPRAWPGSNADGPPLRMGQRLQVPAGGWRWVLRRNCSMAPQQLLAICLSMAALSVIVAAGFWWHGLPWVLPFAGLELAGLTAAFVCHARHAGDHETLTLADGGLLVERQCGSRLEQTNFRADWLQVQRTHNGGLVSLRGQGRQVLVGRHLRPLQRQALAQELRQALRAAPQDSNGN